MRLIRLAVVLTLSLTLAPLAGEAQQAAKVHQIGYLSSISPVPANRVEALRIGLRDLGYVEGKNIAIAFRPAETAERLPEAAADLVRLGHVASLARPGGNITGLSGQVTELVVKELEIMKQTLPRMTRIGVLVTLTAPSHRPALHALEAAAPKLGVQVLTVPVRTPEALDGAFAMMARERVNGFLAVASPLTRSQRALIAELSLKHRLAGMFGTRENVEAGGLMSYGADLDDLTRRAATYIDKILKGVKPADLPVEQPTKFDLVVNMKTAKALGLTIPPSVLG